MDEDTEKIGLRMISSTYLFNRLTNLDPILLVDLRPFAEYEPNHFFGSYWIKLTTQAPSGSDERNKGSFKEFCQNLLDILRKRQIYGQIILVFILPKNQASLPLIQGFQERIWKERKDDFHQIHSSYFLDCSYEEFHQKYSKCQSFFEISNQSSTSSRQSKKSNFHSYPNEIIPNKLYLGHERHANDPSVIDHLNLTHIIDATGVKSSEDTALSEGLSYLPLHLWDTPEQDIAQYFGQSNEFIHTALTYPTGDYRVLIHCRAGISRSTTLVIAYLLHLLSLHRPVLPLSPREPSPSSASSSVSELLFTSFTTLCPISSSSSSDSLYLSPFRDILSYLLLQRPVVYPNQGFCYQLLSYESSLFNSPSHSDTLSPSDDLPQPIALSYESYGEIKKHIRSCLHWKNDISAHSSSLDERALPCPSLSPEAHLFDEAYLRSLGAFEETTDSEQKKKIEGESKKPKKFLRRGEGKQKKCSHLPKTAVTAAGGAEAEARGTAAYGENENETNLPQEQKPLS
jgi:predicted protein tyrosine phosphatase